MYTPGGEIKYMFLPFCDPFVFHVSATPVEKLSHRVFWGNLVVHFPRQCTFLIRNVCRLSVLVFFKTAASQPQYIVPLITQRC